MTKIVSFKASNFEGPCNVDEDFVPYLQKVNSVLIKHTMILVVTSSFRKTAIVPGAIVEPAKMSNHMIGHAIDFNLKDIETKEYFNSTKLGDGTGMDEKFCQDVVQSTGLRWGEAFNNPDSIHFDDALNLKNPALWHEKFNALNAGNA